MILSFAMAEKILPIAASLIGKVYTALTSKSPVSIEDEMKQLEALRLKSSEEVIAEADAKSQ